MDIGTIVQLYLISHKGAKEISLIGDLHLGLRSVDNAVENPVIFERHLTAVCNVDGKLLWVRIRNSDNPPTLTMTI